MRRRETDRVRGTTVEVAEAARRLRRSPTPAEEALWQALRSGQLDGLRFRRQHPVGTFVLDFYCAAVKLAVELDGGVHAYRREEDEARTQRLSQYGYRVLRFRNEEVLGDMGSVLSRVRAAAHAEPSPSIPLPMLGEGGENRRGENLSPSIGGEAGGEKFLSPSIGGEAGERARSSSPPALGERPGERAR